ncbi:MAG: hypothetical protein AAB923_00375 [Patescibacteria group bacterium]
MSKGALILLLGLVTAFLPFTGFPSDVKILIAVLAGFLLMGLGFMVRQERLWLLRALSGERTTDAYTENSAAYRTPSRDEV